METILFCCAKKIYAFIKYSSDCCQKIAKNEQKTSNFDEKVEKERVFSAKKKILTAFGECSFLNRENKKNWIKKLWNETMLNSKFTNFTISQQIFFHCSAPEMLSNWNYLFYLSFKFIYHVIKLTSRQKKCPKIRCWTAFDWTAHDIYCSPLRLIKSKLLFFWHSRKSRKSEHQINPQKKSFPVNFNIQKKKSSLISNFSLSREISANFPFIQQQIRTKNQDFVSMAKAKRWENREQFTVHCNYNSSIDDSKGHNISHFQREQS